MNAPSLPTPPAAAPGQDPTWLVARYFPAQGQWTQDTYLSFAQDKYGLELIDGYLETIPMPTEKHQEIIYFLVTALRAFVKPRGLGRALQAGLRIRLSSLEFREPDVVFLSADHDSQRQNEFWVGADLVMEVISADDPSRDYVTKRARYAKAGISEYWIVDPFKSAILVLVLKGHEYVEGGNYGPGEIARSILVAGFEVSVSECLAAGD